MLAQIDRAPVTGAPPLPPFLRPKGPERGEWVIMPDITKASIIHTVKCVEENWITLLWVHMIRFRGNFEDLETSTIYHRKYRNWLETYQTEHHIPPHVQFGGAIVAGERDETFFPRWVKYAQLHFC